MLRQPGSAVRGRPVVDAAEGQDASTTPRPVVLGHQPGKGKHKGRLGALVVQLARRHGVLRRHRASPTPTRGARRRSAA